MTIWFLAFLALVWVGAVIPSILRSYHSSPLPSSMRFKRTLRGIAAPQRPVRPQRGRWVILPKDAEHLSEVRWYRSQRRRKWLLVTLFVAVAVTGVFAITRRGGWIETNLALDAVLTGYVWFLVEVKKRRVERIQKVRAFPARPQGFPGYDELLQASGGRAR